MQRGPSNTRGQDQRARNHNGLSINSEASSSSSYYQRNPSDTTHARSASPPASAYFSNVPLNHAQEPQPAPDAGAHFAYSTTLRRHHGDELLTLDHLGSVVRDVREEGPSGLWHKVTSAVQGRLGYEAVSASENGHTVDGKADPQRSTPSALFVHYTIQDTVAHFHSSETRGLPASAVPAILARVGYNEFSVSSPEPVLLKFAKTIYESPLILLLCGSAVVSAVMGNVDDAVSITVAILIVLTVGFVQERRSEKSLEALNKLVPHHCHVIRDGHTLHLLANELVPGDLVTFTTGDRIPADVRITSSVDLEIDESSLTGETTARRKDAAPCRTNQGYAQIPSEPVALAERSCIAYMGTLVRNGRGSGIVIATGTETEFGVIFSMMQDVEEKRTPLQLSMDELAKKLSMISFGVIGVICLIGVLQRRSWLDMFTIGVSLAVAAIPEGLPIVTTVTLALGVLRMAKRKAIVKKLHSVEALGSVSVICSDKTGTLTQNEQTVVELYAVDEVVTIDPHSAMPQAKRLSPAMTRTLEIGSLCNNATLNEEGHYVGQATDVALLNVLSQFGLSDQRQAFTRATEQPFSSEKKFMAVSGFHTSSSTTPAGSSRETYYIKGSIDSILDRCKTYYVSDDSTPHLDSNTRKVIMDKAQATASRGLRVLAMASGHGPAADFTDLKSSAPSAPASRAASPFAEKSGLTFVGFQAMLDPPRKGVADSIGLLQSGGVQVVMITGDSEQTALAIARDLGLRVAGGHRSGTQYPPGASATGLGGGCITGQAIDRMTKAQLREVVGGVSVFARTTPRHKMAIVEAFQSRGAVVAMTGDGVNDAPALKMADIGISMGKSGTDVAKEAADMILVDDNFSTILPAVEEGKSIFHNIQNFLSFQLSTAAAALTLITLSTFFGLSNPLNAMQILFINILMDGPPSQSLGVDPVDASVMRKPPRRKNEPIITRRLLYRVLFSASIIVVGTLFIYAYALSDDHMSRREQTMTFTCFVFLDLVSALQNRGLGCALIQNKMLLTTVSISFLSQLALVYVPMMQAVFQTEGLSSNDLTTLLLLAGASFALHEGRRRYERKLERSGTWASAVEEMA
ncbi:Ca-transporting ATPase [Punctularia strigosozonata HHB-11173 SS5]|uniref:Ca-transporting ATPase n=1 Tax=Punctularia strigosozonata (strain HHB-11173) TaxID=741275 RepID=UPI0004417465|nr:Ca-transporting ATPase [Punctularia strigosozonata HHB-11173 SS5]EIN06438.1 Ca-transporting ATPase [Punctularia strigosozonata HHB-11173 SS5]